MPRKYDGNPSWNIPIDEQKLKIVDVDDFCWIFLKKFFDLLPQGFIDLLVIIIAIRDKRLLMEQFPFTVALPVDAFLEIAVPLQKPLVEGLSWNSVYFDVLDSILAFLVLGAQVHRNDLIAPLHESFCKV